MFGVAVPRSEWKRCARSIGVGGLGGVDIVGVMDCGVVMVCGEGNG